MARNGINRRAGRPRRPQASKHLKRMIDRIDYGVKFVPTADPPEFTRSPWWPVTIVFKPDTAATFNYKSVADALHVFFGVKRFPNPSDDTKSFYPFLIRPQTVRMWGLDKQSINLEVYEIVGGGKHRTKQLADMGSGMNFSRLGWRYGAAAQFDPNSSEDTPIFSVTPNGKVIVYLQALICLANGFELAKMVQSTPYQGLTLESMTLE